MQKCLIFILALFSLAAQARANWNPYSMTHERFVHLSEYDKKAVVISTMELMVELESQYQKEVKTSGFSQEKYDKFVQVLIKLQSFVLNSAIAAAGDKSLPELAEEFSKLLSTLGSNGCVYGGYVSKMATLNGVKYCRHPSSMKDSNPSESAIKKAYLSNGGTCKGPHKISCNPVVFGYDSSSGNTPFCVETGYLKTGKAHNVSYDCMKKALEETSDKEARLKVLTDAMSVAENKEAFNKVHSFIFQTCACGKTSINEDYARYIKPHRTCFGMMNTLRVVKNNECELINQVDPVNFANEWARYFGKADTFPDLMPERSGDFDKAYKTLIDNQAIKGICDGKLPVVVTPEPATQDDKKWTCTTDCSEVSEADVKKIVCKVTKAGWDIIKDGAESFEEVELESSEVILASEEATEVKVKIKGSDSEQTCEASFASEIIGPACTIVLADVDGDPSKSKATVTFQNLKEGEEAEFKWSDKGAGSTDKEEENTISKTDKAQEISVSFTIKGSIPVEGSEPFTCPATIPPLDSDTDTDKDFSITAKTETVKPQDPNATVKATVKKKDAEEIPEGFYVSWSREGADPVKVDTKTEAGVQDTPPATDTDEDKKEEEEEEEAVVEAAAEIDKGISTSQPRGKTDYRVCATLKDSSGKAVTEPSCDTIPALKEEATKPAYNPGQNAPPPQFMSPVNNTRQMGIL